MLKYFAIIILIHTVTFSAGQNIDSLKTILSSLKDTGKVDCLNQLSDTYVVLENKESAILFAELAYTSAKRLNYISGIANSLVLKSKIARHFDDNFQKSEALAKEAVIYFEKTDNKKGINGLYFQLWDALYDQGKYDEARYFAQKLYDWEKRERNQDEMVAALEEIGFTYYQQGNFEYTFYYLQQGHEIAQKTSNRLILNNDFYYFATLYKAIGDNATALDYFRQGLKKNNPELEQERINMNLDIWVKTTFAELLTLQHQYDSARYYYNLFDTLHMETKSLRVYLVSIGEYYLAVNNYLPALANFKRALIYHKKLNDVSQVIRSQLDIAKAYLYLHVLDSAFSVCNQALSLALQTKSKSFIRDSYEILYSLYEKKHKTDSAFYYYRSYVNMKELIINDQIKGKIAASKYEHRIELFNNERLISNQHLKIQQQELERQRFQGKFFIISVIVLLLTTGFIFLKRKHEKLQLENELRVQKLDNQRQLSELEMQVLRSQMNPHFVFNCLSSINSFILKNKTEEASKYLTKFSRLIRMVLNNSKQSFISLEEELETLRLYLDMEKLRFKNTFEYTFNLSEDIEVENIFVPPLLLQPFAENAIWHGLIHKKESGFLNFDLSIEEKILICIITDNGIGREKAETFKSKSAENQKSLGLKITSERLSLFNKAGNDRTFFSIEDLKDKNGNAIGTRVHLKINYRGVMEV